MKLLRVVVLFCVAVVLFSCSKDEEPSIPVIEEPVIENKSLTGVISLIDKSDVEYYINHLQQYKTRFMLADNRLKIARWIKSEFESMGFDTVEIDSFECNTIVKLPYLDLQIDTLTMQYNVIAELRGTEKPDNIFIIGGHYDSISENSNMFETAPGADDNASGTSAVLVAAKAVMENGYKPKGTLKFVTFGAEELMLAGYSGSEYYVDKAVANKENIKLMINNDMIANAPNYPVTKKIFVSNATYSFPNVLKVCSDYTNLDFQESNFTGSDIEPFISNGYEAVYFHEGEFSEYYHSNQDVISKINLDFCTEVIKASCAVLLSMDKEYSK